MPTVQDGWNSGAGPDGHGKSPPPMWFKPWTVQPVVSSYTVYTILATTGMEYTSYL